MKRLLRYPLSFFCIVLTWVLCLMPAPQMSVTPPLGADKLVHTAMYLGTCSIIWWEWLRSHPGVAQRRALMAAVVLPTLMSGIIELVQEYATATRSGDWWDMAANTLGVLLAIPVGLYLCPRIAKALGRRRMP